MFRILVWENHMEKPHSNKSIIRAYSMRPAGCQECYFSPSRRDIGFGSLMRKLSSRKEVLFPPGEREHISICITQKYSSQDVFFSVVIKVIILKVFSYYTDPYSDPTRSRWRVLCVPFQQRGRQPQRKGFGDLTSMTRGWQQGCICRYGLCIKQRHLASSARRV